MHSVLSAKVYAGTYSGCPWATTASEGENCISSSLATACSKLPHFLSYRLRTFWLITKLVSWRTLPRWYCFSTWLRKVWSLETRSLCSGRKRNSLVCVFGKDWRSPCSLRLSGIAPAPFYVHVSAASAACTLFLRVSFFIQCSLSAENNLRP